MITSNLIQFGKRHASLQANALVASLLTAVCVTAISAQPAAPERHPLMHLNLDQMTRMKADHLKAQPMQAAPEVTVTPPNFPPSLSLLPYLPYIPAQRDQGQCGDCWAWAGTGVMEIAHNMANGVASRLSVQLLNSCNPYVNCCDGGWLNNVAQFYSYQGFAVPWNNTNAAWTSGDGFCGTACGSIASAPQFPIASASVATVPTWGVGQAQAIANIKTALNQNMAIWFGFFMPYTNFVAFDDYWDGQNESAQWTNFDPGQMSTDSDPIEGHAVLCVGYDDTDPAGPTWIMVNSWGTTPDRTNGIFHVSQNINYDGTYISGGYEWYQIYWETLNIQFAPQPSLQIALAGADSVVLTWPSAAAGYQLQRKTTLNAAIWSDVTTTPVLVNNQCQVTLPKSSANSFFRLMAP